MLARIYAKLATLTSLIRNSPNMWLQPQECLSAFNSLWADKGVQLAILKGNQYALHDNLS
jgi:guanine nucleotide-binding protein subunit alpha